MALARVHVWGVGDLLKAADLNGEFNNILTNPISLISPSTGVINFALQAHTNLVPTAITGTSGSTGQVLTVSALGSPIWATPGAITSTGIRILQWQTGNLASDNVSSTTPTNLTGAAVAITPTSTNSKIVLLYSATGIANAQNGIGAQLNFDIVTSSGILPGSIVQSVSANNAAAVGIVAGVSWTILADASPAPYPTTYTVRGYSNSSTQVGVQGSLSNLSMILVELSS